MKAEEARTLALKARAPADAEYLQYEFNRVYPLLLQAIELEAKQGHSCAQLNVDRRFYTLVYTALRALGYSVFPMPDYRLVVWA